MDLSVKTAITVLWNVLLMKILEIYGELDFKIILYGNILLSGNQNKDSFRAVQVFLKIAIYLVNHAGRNYLPCIFLLRKS